MKKFLKAALTLLLLAAAVTAAYRYKEELPFSAAEEEGTASVSPVIMETAREITDYYIIEKITEDAELPASYDYREEGRSSGVLDQGDYGTCWAFAALTALETSLMPDTSVYLSRDHLNYHNSYGLEIDGGSMSMSIAYLTAWQGPVLNEDDPYGDGISPTGLEAAFHVQEVRMPDDKDYEAIKQTVYLYGGVESSLYLDITNGSQDSASYSTEFSSYYYSGDGEPNHDVVIIGWDDDYPAENFQSEPPGDGAFICQNSWGDSFGDGGIFYVSYYDTNIGTYNAAYTKVESPDNYDLIYQTDLCGFTGQLGYMSEKAYFANVYTAGEDIEVRAVGFYATGGDTEYRIGVITDYRENSDFNGVEYTDSGYIQYAGFYTIELEEEYFVEAGDSFAVVVQIMTEGSSYPVAMEYAGAGLEDIVDLSDGEGYVNENGSGDWDNTETNYSCNLCLKAYADRAS